jgi:RNA polymerase sigma factor (sigma-70 family)
MCYKSRYQKLNDHQLWNRIRNEDKHCLSVLYSRYHPRLFNYGFKIVQNDEFNKDCIQELFCSIWEQRKTVSNVHSVNSYLYVSMRRTIFNKLRKDRSQVKRNTLFAKEYSDYESDIETLIINSEFENEYNHLLKNALCDLSNRQKEIIELKYIDGLSNSEIAGLLQINRQSVYNHVSEAIKQLKFFVSHSNGANLPNSPIHSYYTV